MLAFLVEVGILLKRDDATLRKFLSAMIVGSCILESDRRLKEVGSLIVSFRCDGKFLQ